MTTGIAAGVVLLGTAAAGFHDLARLRPARLSGPARLSAKTRSMIVYQADSPVTGFRPFFNPATGEWIEYTAITADNNGQLVRLNWHSVPGGGVITSIPARRSASPSWQARPTSSWAASG